MACNSVCGDSNIPVLIQSNDSLWVPSSSSFQGQEKLVTIVNVNGGDNMETPILQSLIKEENAEDDSEICFFSSPRKKRRLTAAQVQFLERSFEVENRLEPERKVQLAKEVGLHPRQVAVWFQNRRARYKNKQLEKDYDSLKASFDKLKSEYDCLLEEKNSLQDEVSTLKRKLAEKDKVVPNIEPVEPTSSTKPERRDLSPDAEAIAAKSSMLIVPKQEKASSAKSDDVETIAAKSSLLIVPKQEAASSAKSDVFDSDSPHSFLEIADSSHIFEADQYQSDFSQDEEDIVDLGRSFIAKFYDEPAANSCSFEFPVEDQPFWSWSY